MPKRIVVTLHADGTVRAESTGRQGPACIDDVALIGALLPSARVEASKLTDEFHQPVQHRVIVNDYIPNQTIEGSA